MKLTQARLTRELIAAANTFHEKALWQSLDDDECLAVDAPGVEHTLFALILGDSADTWELLVLRGEHAARRAYATLVEDPTLVDVGPHPSSMSLVMARYADVPSYARSFLKKARGPRRRESLVPWYMAEDDPRMQRRLDRDDMTTFLYVLKAILTAHERDALTCESILVSDHVLKLSVTGDPLSPDVVAAPHPKKDYLPDNILPVPDIPEDIRNLPHLPERWLASSVTIKPEPFDFLPMPRVIFLMDEASQMLIGGEYPGEAGRTATDAFFDTFRGKGFPGTKSLPRSQGLPEEILTNSPLLYATMNPTLDALGIACQYEPDLPILDGLTDRITTTLTEHLLSTIALDTPLVTEPPAPDDLDNWRLCREQLVAELGDLYGYEFDNDVHAQRRYFGDQAAAEKHLGPDEPPLAQAAYEEWMTYHYRAAPSLPTIAERALDVEDWLTPQRMLLQWHAGGAVSIYQIEAISPGVGIEVVDVLFGGRATVQDKLLSLSAEEGLALPACIYPVGDGHCLDLFGPPIDARDLDAAMAFLEDVGMPTTRSGVTARCELFGRLWKWAEGRGAAQRHTAEYDITDEVALRAALDEREDIEQQNTGQYIWLAQDPTLPLFQKIIQAGYIAIEGATCTAQSRYPSLVQRLRTLLDAIPGLRQQKQA